MSRPVINTKFQKPHSLSSLFTVSFLALSLTSLAITVMLGTFFSFQAQQNVVFVNQQLIAQDAANTVSSFIFEKFGVLEITARLIDPTVTSLDEQKRILTQLLGFQQAFRQLVLFDKENRQLVAISRLSKAGASGLAERVDNDLFAQIKKGNKYISTVYVDKITFEPMVLLAVSAKDVFKDFQGTLLAEVNLKFMWNLMDTLQIGKTGQVYVVDRQGTLIAFNEITRVLKGENVKNIKAVADYMRFPAYFNNTQAKIFKGINGTMVVGTYIPLVSPDWAVVTEIPIKDAYKGFIKCMIASIIVMIVIAVLAGWIGAYQARRLAVPLVNLMETATRIADGELELQAEVSGPSEIVGLAKAFNVMTAQLQSVIYSLEKQSEYLQTIVQKYVEYMVKVGQGKLDARLELKEDDTGETNDPLLILGRQLNETTANLQQITKNLKEREAELEVYSEKLKKSNMELEQFAYVASHDLQEPLRKIRFFGDKIKENYSNVLDERAADYLQRMHSAVTRMENLINDLLQYSRVTSQARQFESVDLNKIIHEVLSDMEIRINKTNAEIITDNLPVINANPIQMKQLFQNIIGNAIKYQRENIPPVINIRSKITTGKDNIRYCEISIADNGVGFDNKYAEKIFGLFQRLYGRDEYEGTGIGLAICRKIVSEHKGSITAKSKIGEGSTFTIVLPLNQEMPELLIGG